ncbi:MAG: hypothetical protein JXK07_06280 [Spirochaetes bacterium]|nr:hypothetical protein [Spirochaetota bacterium]
MKKQEAREIQRKQNNDMILKATQDEIRERYRNFAKCMEVLYKKDPSCSDTKKIAALCRKYLSPNQVI